MRARSYHRTRSLTVPFALMGGRSGPLGRFAGVTRPSAVSRSRVGCPVYGTIFAIGLPCSVTVMVSPQRQTANKTQISGLARLVQQPQQVLAVAALHERLGDRLQLSIVDPARAPRDLLDAAD